MTRLGNYSCQIIVDTLMFSIVFTGNVIPAGITVIKPSTNKSCCDSFSD